MILKAEKEFGPVDILINNAGVMHLTYMKNVRVDEWEEMVCYFGCKICKVDINIKGVMYGIAAVLPGMLKRKCGDIVNISSGLNWQKSNKICRCRTKNFHHRDTILCN